MKYFGVISLGRKRAFMYRYEIVFKIFVKIISIFILQKFWKTLYFNEPEKYYYMINYSIISQALGVIYNMNAPNNLSYNVRTGGIAIALLKPWNYIVSLLCEDIGTLTGNFIVIVMPLIFIVSIFCRLVLPTFKVTIIFFICIFMAFLILFLIRVIVSMLCFWLVEASSFLILINVVVDLLSGQFLPTWIVPVWLKSVMNSLPFIWIYQKPIEIYLSNTNSISIVSKSYSSIIMMQVLWITVLLVVTFFMWKRAIQKLNIQGG